MVFGKGDGDQAIRRESLYGSEDEMAYGGVMSFMRRKYTRDLTGVDVAVSGVPWDVATTGRAGARFGPRGVRNGTVGLAELRSYAYGFDPFDTLACIDWGDVYIDSGHPEEIVELLENHARTMLDADVSMLTLGGDHFITYPLLRAHHAKHGPISLVHFDAHVDTWNDDGTRLDHGSMFRRALNEGLIDPHSSVQIGIRTWNSDDFGFTILGAPWVHDNGPAAVVDVVNEVVGHERPAYVTFDIDCLDPAYAPGTGTPVSGGLTTAQAMACIRGLGDLNLVGMDVVEVAPPYDISEITSVAGATMAYEYLCLLAIKKGAVPEPPFGRWP